MRLCKRSTVPPIRALYVDAPPFRRCVITRVASSSLDTFEWGKTVAYERRLNNAILMKFASVFCRYD